MDQLTDRERSVARLLARGASNKEIAVRLHLAPGYVRKINTRIFAKLNVRDRTGAAVKLYLQKNRKDN